MAQEFKSRSDQFDYVIGRFGLFMKEVTGDPTVEMISSIPSIVLISRAFWFREMYGERLEELIKLSDSGKESEAIDGVMCILKEEFEKNVASPVIPPVIIGASEKLTSDPVLAKKFFRYIRVLMDLIED